MRKDLCFLFALFVINAARADDEFSQSEIKEFASHLAQYTNAVYITTNLILYLSSDGYGGYPASQFKANELLSQGVETRPFSLGETNAVYYYILPYNQTFEFHLFDKTGQEIEKTQKGFALSNYSKSATDRHSVHNYKMIATRSGLSRLFSPDDVFIITNKGVYDMTISIRICVPLTNGVPDINAMSNPFRVIQARDYGIVKSDSLRVKVVKD